MAPYKLLVFVILVLATALPCAAAQGELALTAEKPVRLLGRVDTLVDQSGRMTIEQIAGASAARWSRPAALPAGAPWNQTVVWYRFIPQRGGADDAFALAWPSVIGRVDLYCEHSGAFVHTSGGYGTALKSLTDHIMLLPASAYGHRCYLRAVTGFFRSSPVIVTLTQALARDTPLTTIFGGFFVAIALINFVLFFVLRERALLVYAGVMLVLLGLLATDDALWRFVPSTAFVREFSHAFFGWLYFAGTALFARTFLRLPSEDPKADRWILALVGVSAFELVADLFPTQPAWIDSLSIVFVLALLLAIFIAGVRSARRGFRAARFFIAGSAAVCVGVASNLLVQSFQLPSPQIVVDLFEISIGWEALMLTVAIADRMHDLARENVALQLTGAELRILAERDSLTGVPNRRAFDDRLREEWNRAVRAGAPLGLIMIDVDYFKAYNDVLGHIAGDACLKTIAQVCAAALKRSGDFFARYGGEEFAAIIAGATEDDLAVIGEQMRRAVASEGLPHPADFDRPVTISLGTARLVPTSAVSPAKLVAAADAALYEAKFGGRNRVAGAFLGTL